jgi:hypothetical protein
VKVRREKPSGFIVIKREPSVGRWLQQLARGAPTSPPPAGSNFAAWEVAANTRLDQPFVFPAYDRFCGMQAYV